MADNYVYTLIYIFTLGVPDHIKIVINIGHYFNIHTPVFEKWPKPLKVAAPTFKYQ